MASAARKLRRRQKLERRHEPSCASLEGPAEPRKQAVDDVPPAWPAYGRELGPGRIDDVLVRNAEIRASRAEQISGFVLHVPMHIPVISSAVTVAMPINVEQISRLSTRARAALERAAHEMASPDEDVEELLDAIGEELVIQICAHVGRHESASEEVALTDATIAARRAVALPAAAAGLHPLNDFPGLRARCGSGGRQYAVSFPPCDSLLVATFYELAITLRDCLAELGHEAIVCGYGDAPKRRHIAL